MTWYQWTAVGFFAIAVLGILAAGALEVRDSRRRVRRLAEGCPCPACVAIRRRRVRVRGAA